MPLPLGLGQRGEGGDILGRGLIVQQGHAAPGPSLHGAVHMEEQGRNGPYAHAPEGHPVRVGRVMLVIGGGQGGQAAQPPADQEQVVLRLVPLQAFNVPLYAGRLNGLVYRNHNEEAVARAVFECSVPVISAVGHETDTTIIDFVADLRAPTPSAAAELAVYDIRELSERFSGVREMYRRGMERKLREAAMQLQNRKTRLRYLSPLSQIREKRNFAMNLEGALQEAMDRKLAEKRQRLLLYIERLKGLSPLEKLKQGYSYVSTTEGETLISVKQVKAGDRLKIYVTDGFVEAEAKSIGRLK